MTASYPGLHGRAAVVTGGATGIGAAVVRALAAQGCRVGFLDIDAAAGTALAAELGASFVECDLTDIPALRRAMDTLHERLGPARVLVNNAANDRRIPFAELTPEQFDWTVHVNLRHVVFATQHAAPAMRGAGGGSVVNLSSMSWQFGGRDLAAYAATKAAIVGLTNALARDLGPGRIRVNAVAPGVVLTDRQKQFWFTDPRRHPGRPRPSDAPRPHHPRRRRPDRPLPRLRRQPRHH